MRGLESLKEELLRLVDALILTRIGTQEEARIKQARHVLHQMSEETFDMFVTQNKADILCINQELILMGKDYKEFLRSELAVGHPPEMLQLMSMDIAMTELVYWEGLPGMSLENKAALEKASGVIEYYYKVLIDTMRAQRLVEGICGLQEQTPKLLSDARETTFKMN